MKVSIKSGRASLLHNAAGDYAAASKAAERAAPIEAVAAQGERLQQERNLSGRRTAQLEDQLETRFVWTPEIRYVHKQYAQYPEAVMRPEAG